MDKNIQLFGLILLFWVCLNGYTCIYGKKRARLSIRNTTLIMD
jgi:hypothetical protein